MPNAVEAHAIVEIYALFPSMNALCRIVEIGCTISEIRADCLYLDGKRCRRILTTSMRLTDRDLFRPFRLFRAISAHLERHWAGGGLAAIGQYEIKVLEAR